MAINLHHIAAKAGTSLATVSRVLSRDKSFSVSRATRERVIAAAAELRYRPSRTARFLQQGRSGIIAMVMSDYQATSWIARQTMALNIKILQGINDTCATRGYNSILIVPDKNSNRRIFEKELINEQHVDGMILFGEPIFAEYIPKLLEVGIKCVSFWTRASEYSLPRIVSDTAGGIRSMAAAARELGHVKAACISNKAVINRLKTFGESCAQHGIALPKAQCMEAEDEAEAYRSALQILRWKRRPTLIFCTSDHFAVAAIKAAGDLRLRVPHDISVVGCDDAPYVPNDIVPLATIRLPRYEMGQLAVRTLMSLMDGEDIPAHMLSLDCPFVRRASLGNAPQARKARRMEQV